jgi:apolipoprotein N-acyltransferase
MQIINTRSETINLILNYFLYYIFLILFSIIWGIGHYPKFFFLRFIGLIPFIYIILYRKHYLLETLLFGWLAYILNFYWLYFTFLESGKLPIYISFPVILALCLYYGLQYPIIAFIFKKIYKFNKYLIYTFPLIFLTIDFLYPKLFKHSIGDSQIGFFYFIQIIDIAGMSLVIIIIMLTNIGLYQIINKIIKKTKIKIVNLLFILPLLIAMFYGILRLNYLEKKQKNLNTTFAAMIQGNITGKQKMDASYFRINIDRYNQLTQQATEKYSPDFIIWPESIFNRAYNRTPNSLYKFIYSNYPPLILGVTTWEEKPDRSFDITNSALLIKKRKEVLKYDKKHLLIFGEYIPFEETLPFLRQLTPLKFSMRSGFTSSIFKINDNIKASISICFEDIFPNEIRKQNNEGSNLMINITNDSWYGKGLGPLHHSILARLRAIENRRSFYRCTPTGLTTATDITGKIIAKGKIWELDIVTAELPLNEGRPIYSYIGELLSYLSVITTILLILAVIIINIIQKTKKYS